MTRPMLDLRSDTVTRPSAAMRRAMADAEVGDDVLDGDPTTRRLESAVAERLGKEKALFFPSGSMANLTAIWLHTQPGTELFADAESHIVNREQAGAAGLCGVQIRAVRGAGLVFTAAELAGMIRPPSVYSPQASLVCVENTHNSAGGVVTPLAELQAIAAVARAYALPVHLDGARLWNASTATGTSLAEFSACADTVMVSFSKGLGAPVGAALAGSATDITLARRIRTRFGGGMRQSGVIAAAALFGLENNYGRLSEDHAAAQLLAQAMDGAGGATVVAPETNILMIDLPESKAEAVAARAAELGVLVTAWTPSRVRVVTHLDAPLAAISAAAPLLRRTIEEVLG